MAARGDPQYELPAGACDCAIHIYDTEFETAPTATFKPSAATFERYQSESRHAGLQRVVIAQPSAYGFDNTCTLRALASAGDNARGLAVIAPGTDDDVIQHLHDCGMRGIRYMLFPGGALGADAIEDIAYAIAPVDWHINVRLPLSHLPSLAGRLERLPVKTVVDLDLGCHSPYIDLESEDLSCLRQLVEAGRTWIKIAAPYRNWLPEGIPVDRLTKVPEDFIARYPERCLWASNWPHPNVAPMPAMGTQLGWMLDRFQPASRRRILAENPAELYGF